VPVESASNKAAYSAYALRGRLWKQADRFLTPLRPVPLHHPRPVPPEAGFDLDHPGDCCRRLGLNGAAVPPVSRFCTGGTSTAKRLFRRFLAERLPRYQSHHNQPQEEAISRMSPYLHFGQISPLWLLLELRRCGATEATAAFAEQLVVRRELALNHVWYNPAYDSLEGLPAWAVQTLKEHAFDPRGHCYSPERLEQAETHDPYWNACMKEMRHTGFLHNHLRMYWGKKILEWSPSPEQAFETALLLNNRYFVDGRDPNSFTGVGWLFGLHDRPWPPRPVFGTVRSMTASGLERRCDMQAYLALVEQRLQA
jgi:deoxyribodipyrimidine photo-lyase